MKTLLLAALIALNVLVVDQLSAQDYTFTTTTGVALVEVYEVP